TATRLLVLRRPRSASIMRCEPPWGRSTKSNSDPPAPWMVSDPVPIRQREAVLGSFGVPGTAEPDRARRSQPPEAEATARKWLSTVIEAIQRQSPQTAHSRVARYPLIYPHRDGDGATD